jgi:hypothetical protein
MTQTNPTNFIRSIESNAISLWQDSLASQLAFTFIGQSEPCFLLLLCFNESQSAQAATASELLTIAMSEQACNSAQGLNGVSLWDMAAHACCTSPCHIYLNLDLLTIDPHAQDWGDFKIKPEQVEVQRNELTQAALFKPRHGFVVQVLKTALPTLMDMLRTAQLSELSTVIGKTWGQPGNGLAVLDIYRDAKKQAAFSAADLLRLKIARVTK